MLYCEKCRKLTNEPAARCPACKSKKLREPQPGDAVFLAEKEPIWAGALAELLDKNGIPYLREGALGDGMDTFIGYGLEIYSFYVPYQEYDRAVQLCEDIFTGVTDEDVFVDGDNIGECGNESADESDMDDIDDIDAADNDESDN